MDPPFIAKTDPIPELMRLIRFNKPFGVLTQFRDAEGRPTLGHFIDLPGVYSAGRLDRDSEGLLLLTDTGPLQHAISDPRHKLPKRYWVQVEGEAGDDALAALARGVELRDGLTAPAVARRIAEPNVWPRDPPIRYRAAIPTSWIELTITEGRNRQVRRMTAAVGHPTLRLIRYAIGPITLDGLAPGEWQDVDPVTANAIVTGSQSPRQQNSNANGRTLETPRHRRGGRGARKPLSPGRRGG